MFERLRSLLRGRKPYPGLAADLERYPVGLTVTHTPNPVKAYHERRGGEDQYTWWHRTTVRAREVGVRIEEFGALHWEGRWVFSTIYGRPFTADEFAEWYSCPGAFIPAGKEYSDPNNYSAAHSPDLFPSRSLWYFIGVDERGRRVKGQAVLDCLGEVAAPNEAVSEEVWLHAYEPYRLLDYLGDSASARKLRLLACACVRRIWHLLTDERSRAAVEVAERYADGTASGEERERAWDEAAAALRELTPSSGGEDPVVPPEETGACAAAAAAYAVAVASDLPPDRDAVRQASGCAADAVSGASGGEAVQRELEAQAHLVREVFGNPFAPASVDATWLVWNEGLIPRLAQSIYDERSLPEGTLDPARLAVLADALEDAGCADEQVLSHCRSPGPHTRGCWVVDLTLGKS